MIYIYIYISPVSLVSALQTHTCIHIKYIHMFIVQDLVIMSPQSQYQQSPVSLVDAPLVLEDTTLHGMLACASLCLYVYTCIFLSALLMLLWY